MCSTQNLYEAPSAATSCADVYWSRNILHLCVVGLLFRDSFMHCTGIVLRLRHANKLSFVAVISLKRHSVAHEHLYNECRHRVRKF